MTRNPQIARADTHGVIGLQCSFEVSMKPHRGEEIRSIYVQFRRRCRLRVPFAVYQHEGIPALTRLEMTCTQHAQRTRKIVNSVTGCSRWHIYFRRGCTLSTKNYFLEQEMWLLLDVLLRQTICLLRKSEFRVGPSYIQHPVNFGLCVSSYPIFL